MKRHSWTIVIGVLALCYAYMTYVPGAGTLAPLSTRNVLGIGLIASFFILLVFGNQPKYRLFQIATGVLVPVSVILMVVYLRIDAKGVDGLAIEGRLIEDFSFLFLLTGALSMAFAALISGKRRDLPVMALASTAALAFFVIGMEEVSWLQRELNIESGKFFLEHNAQKETNIHNIYTHESEDLYYSGGFLLLVVVPFFRNTLAERLSHYRKHSAQLLLPPEWLIAPFAVSGAFASPVYFTNAAHVSIFIGSLVILVGMAARHYRHQEWWRFGYVLSTTLLLLLTIIVFYTIDAERLDVRPWVGKEYRELYLAWGIAAYAIGAVHGTIHQRYSWHTPA